MTAILFPPGLVANPAVYGGEVFYFLAGALRNAGAADYWQPISSGHNPVSLDSCTTDANGITLNYSSLGVPSGYVVSLVVVPDEMLAKYGYTCGASVAVNSAVITLARTWGISAQISYTGSAWSVSQPSNPSGNFAVSGFSGGVLTVTHDDLATQGINDVALTARRGSTGIYVPVLKNASGAAASNSFAVEFINPTTGAVVNAVDANMRMFVKRGSFGAVDPRAVDTTAFPNSNLWVLGVMRKA